MAMNESGPPPDSGSGDGATADVPADEPAPETILTDDDAIEVEPEVVDAPTPPKLPGLPAARPPATPPQTPPTTASVVAQPSVDDTIGAARARADETKHESRAALYETEIVALGQQSRKRVALYAYELGELAAERGDEGTAVKAWAQSLQADPTLRPNLWAIRRVFERRQMWPNVLRLIDAELRLAQSPGDRADLHLERGIVLEDRLEDGVGAHAAFNAAIDADPKSLRAYMALERRLLAAPGDDEALRNTVAGMAAATADSGRRAALLIDLARLEADAGQAGIERAKVALDAALALEQDASSSSSALNELERLAVRASRPAWRAEALHRRLALLALGQVPRPPASEQDSNRLAQGVVLHLRLGVLADDEGDRAAAIAAFSAAAELAVADPSLQPMVALQEGRALREAGQLGRAGVLALAFAREAPPPLRGVLLLEAFDLLHAATDDDAAVLEAREAARVEVEAAGLGASLTARARRQAELRGDDEALVRIALADAERDFAGDVNAGGAHLLRAATLLGERLARGEQAIALHERALVALPAGAGWDDHADALEWRLLRESRVEALAELLNRRIERTTEPSLRADLLIRRAGLLADRLGDPAGAAQALLGAIELRPDELRLRYLRVGLLRDANAPAEAAAELAQISARTESVERKTALEIERGALLAWHANDAVAGEQALREALRLSPSDGRATAALEELFERQRGTTVPSDEGERADTLVSALRAQVEAELDPQKVVVTLSRLGELHERHHDRAAAGAVYVEMLGRGTEPDEQAVALRGIARAQAATNDVDGLLATLEREHDLLVEDARPLHRARIAWEKERRGRADAAEPDHLALLEGKASSDVIGAAHIGRLRASLRANEPVEQAKAWRGLRTLVDVELEPARAAIDLELADALRRADELDEANVAVDRALAASPESRAAQLAQLIVAGARDDHRTVGTALAELSSGLDAAPRADVLRRAAFVAWAGGDAEQARARIEVAAGVHADPRTSVVLAEVSPGVAALEARAAAAEGGARVPWLLALAEAQASQGELASSSATIDQLLLLAPRSVLGLELDRRARRAAGDRQGYARRTLALGELVSEVERAARLLVEAAHELEALGDLRAAAYAYREALERRPLESAVATRARAMLHAAAFGEGDEEAAAFARGALAELYTHLLAHVQESDDRLELLLDRAALATKHGDRVAAERDLVAALELDPQDQRGLLALLNLTAEDHARLVEVRALAERLSELALDPGTQREVLLTVAQVEQREGGTPEHAIAALEGALEIEEDTSTMRALATLLRAARRWQGAVDVRKKLIGRLSPVESAVVELEIADLYANGFADVAAARDAAQRALFLDPLSSEAVTVLARHQATPTVGLRAALTPAAEAARALLDDPQRRNMAAQHLVAVARLLDDRELLALAEQLVALQEGRSPQARAAMVLPTESLVTSLREIARAPQVDDVLRELLVAIGETPTRLFPVDARVGKLSKPSSKQRADVAPLESLAHTLGVTTLPIELGDGESVAADDARVAVGRDVLPELTRAVGQLRAARVLWLFGEGLGVLDRVDDAALIGLVAGCLGVAKLPWPAALAAIVPSQQVLDERTRAVDKALARKERKALLALAPKLTSFEDPRRFRAAVLSSAQRAALLVAADLSAVEVELGAERALELGRFAVSAPFIAARHRWHGEGG